MSQLNPPRIDKDRLRREAEAALEASPVRTEGLDSEQIARMIRNLRLHQIELELQVAELEREHQKYADLYQSAPVAYFTIDEGGAILAANQRGADLLGIAREDLIGSELSRFVLPADAELFLIHRAEARRQPRLAECELRMRRIDGEPFFAHLESRLDDREQVQRIVISDVTPLKDAESRLRVMNNTLESLVRERTAEVEARADQTRRLLVELTQAEQRERRRLAQFLHDKLQQLLIGASMNAQVLNLRPLEENSLRLVEKIHQTLQEAIAATRTMTMELCPKILHEAGLGPALDWLADQMHKTYGLRVERRLENLVDPGEGHARPILFESARELLFNIVKHGGTDTALITGGATEDGRPLIEISDQGKGFDPEAVNQPVSSGFGLSSIRHRLELIGGRLEIHSAPGGGCRAVLVGPAPPKAKAPAARRIRLMLVDDQKIVREGLARLLADQPDMDIAAEAADGQIAIDMVEAIPVDVVLMDINMPRMNGVEATRRIHESHPDLPIIGLSIHEEQKMAAAMKSAGAAGYLSKGGPVEDLLVVIRNLAPAQL